MTPALVDIVIVNWNTGRCLHECLRSIAGADQSALAVGEIVVVDNASVDGSAHGLETLGIPLRVVHNTSNRGFAVACNQGAALCRSEYLLFLNPDTRLFPHTLRNVGQFLGTARSQDIGICGGQMVDAQGRPRLSCSSFPTLQAFVGQMTGLDRILPSVLRRRNPRPGEPLGSGPVDQVIGAFNLMRRSLFTDLGGFDERYFLYFEDVDLALRARARGRPSYFISQARVYHAENVSSGQVKGRRLRHWLCSRTLFAFRHMPRWKAWILLVLSLSVEPVARLSRAAMHRNRSEFRDTVQGYAGFLSWLVRHRGNGT